MKNPLRLGRHLDAAERHDPRSRNYPAATAPLETVSHYHHGPVLDQGRRGSCTGNAVVQALNTEPLFATPFPRVLTECNALMVYALATWIDPIKGVWPPIDTGSDGLSAAKAAVILGYATGYSHAFGLTHALGALVKAPVIIGIPWYEGMYSPVDGYLEATGEIVGGHEVALTGINTERENVTVLNSWGNSWGYDGLAYMRWSTLGDLLSQGGDCTVLNKEGR